MSFRKLAVSVVAAAGLALASPASALAQFDLQNPSAQPADTQAGANSDFTIALGFAGSGPADSVRDLTVHLPPGLIGNPLATPLCTVDQLNANACDPATQVGSVVANVDLCIPLVVPLCVPNPLPINGAVYNLEPQPGEPARFGIVLQAVPLPLPGNLVLPPIIQQSAVELRKTDLGLDTVLEDTPNTATVLDLGPGPALTADIRIASLEITLSGEVGGQGFMRNPTSCQEAVTRFDATSHSDEAASGQASFVPTGCGNLPFAPAFSARIGAPGATAPASKPPLTTVIQQTSEEAGLRRAEVILPQGVGADPAILVNQCTSADFAASACPDNTRVGTALAASPVQATPLTGWVALVEPVAPGLPNLGLDLQGALPLQLRGTFVPGPGNVFEGLPDIPISNFELGFDGNALITTSKDLCEPPLPLFTVTFDGHNGAHLSDQVPATVEGCAGSGTGKPKAKVKLSRTGSDEPRMRVKLTAAFSPIGDVKVKMPKALRLAGGNKFDRGSKATADGDPLPDSALGGGARKLKVDVGTGAATLKIKLRDGALKRAKEIDGKLPFKLTITDLAGEKTKLKKKAG